MDRVAGTLRAADRPQRERVAGARLCRAQRHGPVHLTADEVDALLRAASPTACSGRCSTTCSTSSRSRSRTGTPTERSTDASPTRSSRSYRPGDLIWVHDYQLMLVPAMLRERLPGRAHRLLPPHPVPVVRGVPHRCPGASRSSTGCSAPTSSAFTRRRTCDTSPPSALARARRRRRRSTGCAADGRDVRLGVFPMGVDAATLRRAGRRPASCVAEVERAAREPADARCSSASTGSTTPRASRAGCSRSSGCSSEHPELREQGAPGPGRGAVARATSTRYQEFRDAGRRAGRPDQRRVRHAQLGAGPLPLPRSLAGRELCALYRAADVMLVTPLRDGMNLVAKEFVACAHRRGRRAGAERVRRRRGRAGRGAARQPVRRRTDGRGVSTARSRCRARSGGRACGRSARRVHALRRAPLGGPFLERARADASASAARRAAVLARRRSAALAARAAQRRRLVLLLDYDGTLVPFAPTPDLARPDRELLALLRRCSLRPGYRGPRRQRPDARRRSSAGSARLPIWLHAEHGLWSRPPGRSQDERLSIDASWKDRVLPMLVRVRRIGRRAPWSRRSPPASPGTTAWPTRSTDAARPTSCAST